MSSNFQDQTGSYYNTICHLFLFKIPFVAHNFQIFAGLGAYAYFF